MSNMVKSVEVPYIAPNLERCMCPQCPVQSESSCALEKIDNIKREAKKLEEGKAPAQQNVPGVYCSAGEAFCSDLNPSKNCICNTCSVWEEFKLADAKVFEHYCAHGKA